MIKLEEIGDSFIIEQINGKIRLSIIGLESAARLKREWVNFYEVSTGDGKVLQRIAGEPGRYCEYAQA